MHALSQLHLHILQLRSHPVAATLAVKLEGSPLRSAADEDEAQEGECLWLAQTAPLAVRRCEAAELHQSGLLRVQLQPEFLQSLPQRLLEAFRIGFAFEAGHPSSHPEEPPLEVLTEPDLNLSTHPALPIPSLSS